MRKLKKFGIWSKTFLLLSIFSLLTLGAMAQQAVTGTVTDAEGEPIVGATIKIVGSNSGAVTDIDGNFLVNVSSKAVLNVSYIGYKPQKVTVGNNKTLTIVMEEDNTHLNDVVVIGYGAQKKSDLTGAVASVNAADIKNLSTTDAGAALQGKASGVQIINSGNPGDAATIRVRGYSSNSGDISPLLIVDGLKVDNIQYLDPSMIESMEVLKDAASAAIYGAQAGNGVILITTKQGAEGKVKLSYSFKATRQSLGKKASLFNAADYIDYQEYLGNITEESLAAKGYNGQDTDWYSEAFEPSWATNHSFTAEGGNQKGHFLASLNLVNNNGIVKGDKDVYKRLSGQINADYKLFDWFSISTNNSIEKWESKGSGGVMSGYNSILNSVVSVDPLTSPYIDANAGESAFAPNMWSRITNGALVSMADANTYYGTSKFIEDATGNPLFQISRLNKKNSGINVRGTVAANIMPFDGFTYTSRLGYRISQSNYHNYEEPYWINTMSNDVNYSIEATTNASYYYQWENFANYLKTFGKHTIGAMIGMSFTKDHSDNLSVSSDGSGGDQILSGTASNFQYISYLLSDATKTVSGAPNDATSLSYFGRLSYSYDDRYFFQANFRRDAFDSSKLSKQARWGSFPSFSAGWTISNEKFFKDNVDEKAVSFLKLRASWGRNGNVNVLSNYQYSSSISLNSSYYQETPSAGDGTVTLGSKPTGLANPDLKWETSEQFDLGLDARFLSSRLSLGIDYFNKTTKDLLVEVSPIPEIGVSSSIINTGKVLNRGIDFELGWRDHIGDFKYGIKTNFSTLKNEVQEVNDLVERITKTGIDGFNTTLSPTFEKGHSVWYFRGYKYAGVDSETGEAQYYDKEGNITKAPTDEDKQDLGSGIPKFTYGITLDFEYKGFDFTLFGTGAAGNKIYNLMVSADRTQINGINTYWKDSWKQAGDNSKYPDMKRVASDWTFFSSSAAVFSGNYFKIKQIQLGYTLPSKITKKFLVSNLRFYVSMDDFFTFTSYPGADPETASINDSYSRGFDNGTYPTSKKLVFGVNVAF